MAHGSRLMAHGSWPRGPGQASSSKQALGIQQQASSIKQHASRNSAVRLWQEIQKLRNEECGRVQGWESVCLGVRGFVDSWFLGFWFLGVLFSCFRGFKVSRFLVSWFQRFLGFLVSKFLGFKVSKHISCFWKIVIPYSQFLFDVFWKILIPYSRFSRIY